LKRSSERNSEAWPSGEFLVGTIMNALPACHLANRRFRRGRGKAQTTAAIIIQKPIRQGSRNSSRTSKRMLRSVTSITGFPAAKRKQEH
jgi:surfactin synthase thioesterase subunit